MGERLERGKFPDLELAGCGFFRTPRKVKTELSVVGYFRLCWFHSAYEGLRAPPCQEIGSFVVP
jgi:hypothetical protein